MKTPCRALSQYKVVPAGTAASLRLSSGQIGLLRQMARESRTGFMMPRFQRKIDQSNGTLALFSGPKGAGKMLAAKTMSRELGFSIYRVSLNSVVTTSIGETEKNLARLLKTAETKMSVLMLDDADALFGKRGAVKDSHDRYANLETNYFLERLQAYPGLVIVVSNHNVQLDSALGCFFKYHLVFTPPSVPPVKR